MEQNSKVCPINLSFAGCGFLGIYYLGVTVAFQAYAPEVLRGRIAGCSAGALAAVCAICRCCPGQMCSDVLEIAMRARSKTLRAFHPTFDIVGIIKDGLRRILPHNAHELCSERVYISLTRWRDKKNVIVSKFESREELIDVLVCSSFIPFWSGIIPQKFQNQYYFDGGITNNNPIIDEKTIKVAPFAGENGICPKDESGSFYSINFQGTNISITKENCIRIFRALFPPKISKLEHICLQGYRDALDFLRNRNVPVPPVSNSELNLSAIFHNNYIGPRQSDEQELRDGGIAQNTGEMYERTINSDTYNANDQESNVSNVMSHGTELPQILLNVFAKAKRRAEESFDRYIIHPNFHKIGSFMALPFTLPFDFARLTARRALRILLWSIPSEIERLFSLLFTEEDDDQYCYHSREECRCNLFVVTTTTNNND